MKNIKLLILSGSTCRGSYNKMLAKTAHTILSNKRLEASLVELNNYPLPLYDGDLEVEQGYPDNAARLKALMKAHDGIIIASPEYNGSVTGVLKNTLDWLSRSNQATLDNSAYKNKSALLLSTALGSLGGLRGLNHLRNILTNLSMLVVPQQLAIPFSSQVFNEQGDLINEQQKQLLNDVIHDYLHIVDRLNHNNLDKMAA